jgi:lipopolysaccharide transport system ATP-binding protein
MIAIRVEHLSKRYLIGPAQARHNTLRDLFVDTVKRINRARSRISSGTISNEIWALNDVSFEIKKGEVVGVIGRNGAGKSTLLKLLAHVTSPTRGRIEVHGRVGSLLEVGTGFHNELTGRENIYLNGAILGMKRVEINRKFDEIVAFAEIEKFLDTPVKHYSSGMYMRLAFAVAAHLDPEILIVDEVLAVGDAEFQKKCLGKMGDVAREGRTILIVSHNMGIIKTFTQQSLLLNKGSLIAYDLTERVITRYLSTNIIANNSWYLEGMPKSNQAYFSFIGVSDENENGIGNIDSSRGFNINLNMTAVENIHNCQIHVRIINQEGIPILTTANTDINNSGTQKSGNHSFKIYIPGNFLKPGDYFLTCAILIPNVKIYDLVDGIGFTIDDIGNHSTILKDGRLGIITPLLEWREDTEQ